VNWLCPCCRGSRGRHRGHPGVTQLLDDAPPPRVRPLEIGWTRMQGSRRPAPGTRLAIRPARCRRTTPSRSSACTANTCAPGARRSRRQKRPAPIPSCASFRHVRKTTVPASRLAEEGGARRGPAMCRGRSLTGQLFPSCAFRNKLRAVFVNATFHTPPAASATSTEQFVYRYRPHQSPVVTRLRSRNSRRSHTPPSARASRAGGYEFLHTGEVGRSTISRPVSCPSRPSQAGVPSAGRAGPQPRGQDFPDAFGVTFPAAALRFTNLATEHLEACRALTSWVRRTPTRATRMTDCKRYRRMSPARQRGQLVCRRWSPAPRSGGRTARTGLLPIRRDTPTGTCVAPI
jgi:hypothetical protein